MSSTCGHAKDRKLDVDASVRLPEDPLEDAHDLEAVESVVEQLAPSDSRWKASCTLEVDILGYL